MSQSLRVQTTALSILKSPSTYPLSTFWAGAMVVMVARSQSWLTFAAGAAVLAFLALLLILVAFRKDIAVVHVLVNSQHDDLVARVQQLTDALVASDTDVPREPQK